MRLSILSIHHQPNMNRQIEEKKYEATITQNRFKWGKKQYRVVIEILADNKEDSDFIYDKFSKFLRDLTNLDQNKDE